MRLRTVAFGNLRRRSSRAAFLVAGLLIGIATVVTLLTLSRALTVQAQNQLETYGANIVVAPQDRRPLAELRRRRPRRRAAAGARPPRSRPLAHRAPSRTARTSPSSRPSCSARSRCAAARRCSSACAPSDEFELKRWWQLDGRRPTAGDELVAGSSVAGRLGLRIGDTVALDGRDFTVSGILRPTGSQDDELLITELGTAQALLGKPGRVTLVAGRRAVQQLPGRGDRRPAQRRAARHPGDGHAAGHEEPHARPRPVPHLQLRDRRHHHRHRGARRLRHHDGLGQRAHARDRHLPRARLPARARDAPRAHRGRRWPALLAGVLGYLAGMGAQLRAAAGLRRAAAWRSPGRRRSGRRARSASPCSSARWRRCTPRCTPAAWTRPSPCGPSEQEPSCASAPSPSPTCAAARRAPPSSSPASSSASAPSSRCCRSTASMTGQAKATMQTYGANIVVAPEDARTSASPTAA